jgi:DNA-binding PadR family transcriptional regulator
MPLPALSVTQFLVLTALAKEPSYGYALQTQILEDSTGIYLNLPSIYKTLQLVRTRGWVELVGSAASDGPARATYRLTSTGRKVLRAEAHMFTSLGRAALSRTS